MQLRGLTDTKEGRLVVICVVGGSLLLAATVVNGLMGHAADETATSLRHSLRRELSLVSDESISEYPTSASSIERLADKAVDGRGGRVLGTAKPDGEEVVVAVQAGWGWQVRCIKAQLLGDATVITTVDARPC